MQNVITLYQASEHAAKGLSSDVFRCEIFREKKQIEITVRKFDFLSKLLYNQKYSRHFPSRICIPRSCKNGYDCGINESSRTKRIRIFNRRKLVAAIVHVLETPERILIQVRAITDYFLHRSFLYPL